MGFCFSPLGHPCHILGSLFGWKGSSHVKEKQKIWKAHLLDGLEGKEWNCIRNEVLSIQRLKSSFVHSFVVRDQGFLCGWSHLVNFF